jgi:hypothetical protein
MNFSDAQIDTAARRFAMSHQVSYAEALTAVAASFSESAGGQDRASAASVDDSDSGLHFEAMAYHLANRVSYAEAVTLMAKKRRAERAAVAASVGDNHSPDGDRQLHVKAVAYSEANQVSYAEALTALTDGTNGGAQQALQAQVIEIFKAGTHVDTAGNSRVFTVDDVKGMAAVYAPALHEAPLVIGHPMDDKPSQGWVTALEATDEGVLLMTARKVDPIFAADVKAGRFLKRSASFYPPHAPNNPAPGKWYLRHVAWLGAQPPAVKGLADVNFGATNDAVSFGF